MYYCGWMLISAMGKLYFNKIFAYFNLKIDNRFFYFKKSYEYYPVIALFIIIEFSYLLLDGSLIVGASEWYLPILIFLNPLYLEE